MDIVGNRDNEHNSWVIKMTRSVVISILILFIAIIIISNFFNTKNKYYSSLQELAESYYPGENIAYIQQGNYSYVIVDSENLTSKKFVYRTNEGEYIDFKNLLVERFKRKRYAEFKDIIEQNFYSFVHVEMHEGNCIILLERYFVNDEKVDINVYDTYGQLHPIETYSREYYMTLLELDSLEEDYELRVEIGDNSYYIIGTKEFELAK